MYFEDRSASRMEAALRCLLTLVKWQCLKKLIKTSHRKLTHRSGPQNCKRDKSKVFILKLKKNYRPDVYKEWQV